MSLLGRFLGRARREAESSGANLDAFKTLAAAKGARPANPSSAEQSIAPPWEHLHSNIAGVYAFVCAIGGILERRPDASDPPPTLALSSGALFKKNAAAAGELSRIPRSDDGAGNDPYGEVRSLAGQFLSRVSELEPKTKDRIWSEVLRIIALIKNDYNKLQTAFLSAAERSGAQAAGN